MSRGCSFGGGKSSLGYLFEPDEPQCLPCKHSNIDKTPTNDQFKDKETTEATAPPSSPKKIDNINNHHRVPSRISDNIITGRPSTRVQSVPGGSSSLGYLFGDDQT
ncbi:uncharacterized protein A4U43_C04F24910 [Asparagus officinalis]|uniref:Protein SPIRAL1-like 5 n=1 Tax=Asparagus officinalis TaxID=4686 RepID=A0A5P1F3H5_ASPOF|nr:uncharacterized protein A4U43_C04F24910 [Asparagus officinalis]